MSIELVTTDGTFTLDGQSFDVTNNIWLVGEGREVLVIDAAHDATAIATAVGDRTVTLIVCTHGHNDHVNAAVELAGLVDAPVALHPDDRMLWDVVHPDRPPDRALSDGDVLTVGDVELRVLHTPGHSPGSVCLAGDGVLFSGDTLFHGGPGATGRSYSDHATILASIQERLLVLSDDTIVHTGHGDKTTIGDEADAIA